MSTVFTVIRHGETVANLHCVIQGQSDVPLSPVGEEQAKLLARRWCRRRFDAVYSSDLSRAVRTAEIVANGMKPTLTPDLREMDLGEWVGHTTTEVAERFPEEWRAFRSASVECRATGGESRRELLARVTRFFRTAAERHPGKNVLVVTHGGALRAFFLMLMGGSVNDRALLPSTGNTGVSTVRYDPETDRWRLISWNDTSHLESLTNGDDVY